MNQSDLYATLSKAGCKILSFEDYPSQQGSWRTSFFKAGVLCEISCNRFDGYMSLKAKSNFSGTQKSVINSMKFLTDDAELTAVMRWVRSVSHQDQNFNKVILNESIFN